MIDVLCCYGDVFAPFCGVCHGSVTDRALTCAFITVVRCPLKKQPFCWSRLYEIKDDLNIPRTGDEVTGQWLHSARHKR